MKNKLLNFLRFKSLSYFLWGRAIIIIFIIEIIYVLIAGTFIFIDSYNDSLGLGPAYPFYSDKFFDIVNPYIIGVVIFFVAQWFIYRFVWLVTTGHFFYKKYITAVIEKKTKGKIVRTFNRKQSRILSILIPLIIIIITFGTTENVFLTSVHWYSFGYTWWIWLIAIILTGLFELWIFSDNK